MRHAPPIPPGYQVARVPRPHAPPADAEAVALLLDRCRRVLAVVESPRELANVDEERPD